MSALEKTIENIQHEEVSENAFLLFCRQMQHYGYERVVFSLMTDHPTLNLRSRHGLVTNYPEDWMKHYLDKGYEHIDPVRQKILSCSAPFLWTDLSHNEVSNIQQIKMMNEAEEANVANGLGISLMSKYGEIAGLGLARSKNSKEVCSYHDMAEINLLSIYFYEKYRKLEEKGNRLISITKREKEILEWACEGKTDEEISMLIYIEVSTIRFHWSNIFRKLNANSRVYAVAKALLLKLIQPYRISLPYQK
jgi:DNA-binding CsgD family transcriptional regulator